jgi:hypothetical protein
MCTTNHDNGGNKNLYQETNQDNTGNKKLVHGTNYGWRRNKNIASTEQTTTTNGTKI